MCNLRGTEGGAVRLLDMQKAIALLTTTAASSAGWWLGAHAGIFTAFICSMLGFGAGIWGARRVVDWLGV